MILDNYDKGLNISIDHMADTISDIALGEDMQYMSQEERMKVYNEVVEAVRKTDKRRKSRR